jgi:PRTRC genetic system protein B
MESMTSHVRIGDNRIFTLKQAVLLYQDGSTTFATLHEVKSPHERAPYLGAGQSVTTGFLERLARGLGASLAPEVLPANILSRTPELIVWWSPEKRRLMFFGEGNKDATELNGRMYPHPGLVFMLNGRELLVRALGENRRPTADTRLKNAPYWNTDAHGRVCLGSMRVREEIGACSLSDWEDAYFASF